MIIRRRLGGREWKPGLATFLGVFLSILGVGLATVPFFLSSVERAYYRLQADVNARQVRAMSQFVRARLAAGADMESVVQEFQAAVEGTQTDRGYLCLIDQTDARYLSHPDLELLGMAVKPFATFEPDFSGRAEELWQEVGGDYYDFHLGEDNTLSLAVGDATGHGAQAGVLVVVAKSLFQLLAGERDLSDALWRASDVLRRMGLPRLYLALVLGKLRGRTLELAGSGMPPALVYRARDASVGRFPWAERRWVARSERRRARAVSSWRPETPCC